MNCIRALAVRPSLVSWTTFLSRTTPIPSHIRALCSYQYHRPHAQPFTFSIGPLAVLFAALALKNDEAHAEGSHTVNGRDLTVSGNFVLGNGNRVSASSSSHPTQHSKKINLPPINPHFSGRDQELQRLHSQLTASDKKICGVQGSRRVGKTQLALYYAHLHEASYEHVFYLDANDDRAWKASLRALAEDSGLRADSSDACVFEAAKEVLAQQDYLLIIDNIDGKEAIKHANALLPSSFSGSILLLGEETARPSLLPKDHVLTLTHR